MKKGISVLLLAAITLSSTLAGCSSSDKTAETSTISPSTVEQYNFGDSGSKLMSLEDIFFSTIHDGL